MTFSKLSRSNFAAALRLVEQLSQRIALGAAACACLQVNLGAAEVRFEKDSVDVGVISEKGISVPLVIQNPTGETARIAKVETSCGCTVIQGVPDAVGAAGDTQLTAAIDLSGKKGEFSQGVIVLLASGASLQATISGWAGNPATSGVNISNQAFFFPKDGAGSLVREFWIEGPAAVTEEIKLQSNDANIKIEPGRQQSPSPRPGLVRKTYQVAISLDATERSKSVRGLSAYRGSDAEPLFQIPVLSEKAGKPLCLQRRFFLARIQHGEPFKILVPLAGGPSSLTAESNGSFTVEDVQVDTSDGKSRATVALRPDSAATAGMHSAEIVFFDSSAKILDSIVVSGIVRD